MLWILCPGLGFALDLHPLTDPEARCLDGSPYGVYLAPGDPHTLLIYLEEGGSCGDLTTQQMLLNCYDRSKTALGSSLSWPPQLTFPPDSLLGSAQTATIAFLPYCDGTLHHGHKKDPVKVQDKLLYFRGYTNTMAAFSHILKGKTNLTVILSGFSAGAVAAMLYANTLQSRFSPRQLLIMPDSGLFFTLPRQDGVPYFPLLTQSYYYFWQA
jgi:hypothetical protein